MGLFLKCQNPVTSTTLNKKGSIDRLIDHEKEVKCLLIINLKIANVAAGSRMDIGVRWRGGAHGLYLQKKPRLEVVT